MASYSLGDEGAHWRQFVKSQLPPFDRLVTEWMSGRVQVATWKLPL